MKKPIRNVLIVHPYGIGDLIFTTPILRALRLLPGIVRVDLLLGSRTKEMIETNPHVDEIFVIDRDLWRTRTKFENLKAMLSLRRKLKRKHYDLLIDFSMRREYAFWGKFVLGIPYRAGFDYKKRACFHNLRFAIPNGFENKHVSLYYAELAGLAGVQVESSFLEFYLNDQATQTADLFLSEIKKSGKEKIVILAPGGGESWGEDACLKRWPVASFRNFAENITRDYKDIKFVLIGSAKEKELTSELKQALGDQAVDIAGKYSVMEVAAIMEKADLFIGNDGGLMHIAHALRVPTFSLFGPTDPVIYGPYPLNDQAVVVTAKTKPSYARFRYNKEDRSIQSIKPEDAFEIFRSSALIHNLEEEKIVL